MCISLHLKKANKLLRLQTARTGKYSDITPVDRKMKLQKSEVLALCIRRTDHTEIWLTGFD